MDFVFTIIKVSCTRLAGHSLTGTMNVCFKHSTRLHCESFNGICCSKNGPASGIAAATQGPAIGWATQLLSPTGDLPMANVKGRPTNTNDFHRQLWIISGQRFRV